jgi:hypothetical protein
MPAGGNQATASPPDLDLDRLRRHLGEAAAHLVAGGPLHGATRIVRDGDESWSRRGCSC